MAELTDNNCELDIPSFFYELATKYEEISPSMTITLDDEEELYLDEISKEFESKMKDENIEIDTEEFKKCVKNIYYIIQTNSSEKLGGMDPEDALTVPTRQNKITYKDLMAAGALVLGLLCIFISWYKLNNILSSISINGVSSSEITEEFEKFSKEVPKEEVNLLYYILSVMLGRGAQIFSKQEKFILDFLTKSVLNIVRGASNEAIANCFTNTGNTYFDALSNLVTSYVSSSAIQSCILHTGKQNINHQINVFTIQMSTHIATISNLTYFGTTLTYASIVYIGYRIRSKIPPRIGYSDRSSIENGGGYKMKSKKSKKINKSKKTKKTKKSKKSKKSKKTNKTKKSRK
jgi:hypothetical protein